VLPDRPGHRAVITLPWGTIGDLATAAFVVAAASGVAVAVPYDTQDAYGSIGGMLLANPAGAFFRNVHYWSGQLCLVLTLIHVWDHLRASTEHRVSRGVWLRLALTLPLLAFIMLSGFMLRGDADASQALRIVSEATSQIPLLGPLAATMLFGAGGRLDVIYVQHAATATIAVWLFIIEHARRGVWPRASAFVAVTVATGVISLVVSPGLHDGLEPIIKGPWYFLGLQEILHWTPWPLAVVLAGFAIVAALYAVRVLPTSRAGWSKALLLVLALVYLGLCGVGAFLRGESWAWDPGWPSGAGNLRFGLLFGPTPDAPAALPAPLPVVLGRPEGCLICHRGVTGLGNSHRPEAVGCASCHGGDVFAMDKARAHAGMDLIPGNMASARRGCGQAACHATIIPRVERSVMATMSGIIAVDRAVFGEPASPVAGVVPHVQQLGRSPADTHLRQLCASCHLGAEKVSLGPNDEESRGGGCNACHLSYNAAALAALARYEEQKARGATEAPLVHPALSLDIDNGQCFGCHSRSGRISTSYEGWHEVHEPPAAASDPARPSPSVFRTLADERVFERVMPDVHQQRGLDCIDCHTAVEVMGDGVPHGRKSEQLRVGCEDCHARPGSMLPAVPAGQIDPESRRILAVRAWPGPAAGQFVRTLRGDILVNVVTDERGAPALIRKRSGERRELKARAPVCTEGPGHSKLSCGSCHTAWAPRCPTCHTSFDATADAYDWVDDANVKGAWKERSAPFAADRPTLGVRMLPDGPASRREIVDTFVPGMILTIDRNTMPGRPADPVFRRLYARIEPHTTRREARPCTSCHNDPVAIGYGAGVLRLEREGDGVRWTFTPSAPRSAEDGLPADAWIPFLGVRDGMVSTQPELRPFTVDEQRRILRVGVCLTCHDGSSGVMRQSVRDFDGLLSRRSRSCVLPIWQPAAPLR
jgi:quinol-cytochrome oxidoreductase complex cytochrome b subunit